MPDLSPLEEKLGEVIGLAQAATKVTTQVKRLTDDKELKQLLDTMGKEARETVQKGKAVAGDVGNKRGIDAQAKETREEVEKMAAIYLGDDADDLDGFEFLIIAEAGELGHVEIVREVNRAGAKEKAVDAFLKEVLPIQKRHVKDVRAAALKLAKEEAQEEK